MFANKIESFRNKNADILVCLNHSPLAKEQWLNSGGIAVHMLSPRQIQSWLMVGDVSLPKETAFEGSLEEFISLFPKSEIERNKALLNGFLQGIVVEFKNNNWEFFSCNVIVAGCCTGEYFTIVNRKDIN